MKDQMIHHVSVGTNDIKRAKAFYDPLMSLIGFRILKQSGKSAHYGASDIVFSLETPTDGFPATAGNGSEGGLAVACDLLWKGSSGLF
jgi:catechol 2,3-dioxygenase-like lactoylglutathione lyase family enzyme